ncbi:hypothetical protein BIY24_07530 [Halobacteriovorax marinus]|uniref:hypothetical protein n=1 Tax=Halobacteriovorax marinus TaxID=97084 RepID=UPI000305B19E|nr:hypothetical protein [Halobacteriovorax marinus]ATH07803.1 hypothetical protein BIY24_07530 [Halobacteriovorax marinus]
MSKFLIALSLSIFTFTAYAGTSGSLQLSSRIGVNIDYRLDENNNIRIISNAPFKQNLRPYNLKSKTIKNTDKSHAYLKVLEIAAN